MSFIGFAMILSVIVLDLCGIGLCSLCFECDLNVIALVLHVNCMQSSVNYCDLHSKSFWLAVPAFVLH